MGSRVRENPDKIFEVFLEVAPAADSDEPFVLQRYPDEFIQRDVLKSAPKFAFPCPVDRTAVQLYSFVITSEDSKFAFGFCRHVPHSQTCLCIVSFLPWFDFFFKLLNVIAEILNSRQEGILEPFLDSIYRRDVPAAGDTIYAQTSNFTYEFSCMCPDITRLPSIPENRNVMEYFNAVNPNNMIQVFASMLNERRIMFTSKKLSRLTACVFGSASLLYPMHWQHIFIPVLPTHLIDYLLAPMPLIIGVPACLMERAKKMELGDMVILDLDTNELQTEYDDVEAMPSEVVSVLKKRLKNPNTSLGDGLARAFLHALVMLIGGYRDALRFVPGQKITFDRDAFLQSRPVYLQEFLKSILQLQIFQQFVDERLNMLNSGEGFSDEFEYENNMYGDKAFNNKLKSQYKEWTSNMRKEGGALLKSVKNKVKDRSRKTYKDFRTKFYDMQSPKVDDDLSRNLPTLSDETRSSSAPNSPTEHRKSLGRATVLERSGGRVSPFSVTLRPRTVGHGKKDELLCRNEKSKRYSIIDVDGFQSPDDELCYKPVNMNLMADLEAVMYPGGQKDTNQETTTGASENDSVYSSASSSNPTPPSRQKSRSKRSPIVLSNAEMLQLEKVIDQPASPIHKSFSSDVPLIKLDSQESPVIESFDPLNTSTDVHSQLHYQHEDSFSACLPHNTAKGEHSVKHSTSTPVKYTFSKSQQEKPALGDTFLPPPPCSPSKAMMESKVKQTDEVNTVSTGDSLIDLACDDRSFDIFDPLAMQSTALSAPCTPQHRVHKVANRSLPAFTHSVSNTPKKSTSFLHSGSTQYASDDVKISAFQTDIQCSSQSNMNQMQSDAFGFGNSQQKASTFSSHVPGQTPRSSGLFKIVQMQPVNPYNPFSPASTSSNFNNSMERTNIEELQEKKANWEKFE